MPRERKSARLAFRAHKRLLQAIEEEAKKHNTTMSNVMVEILSDRLLPPPLPQNYRHDKEDPLDAIDRLFDAMGSKTSDDSHKLIETRSNESF